MLERVGEDAERAPKNVLHVKRVGDGVAVSDGAAVQLLGVSHAFLLHWVCSPGGGTSARVRAGARTADRTSSYVR
jgi:hypothetical protein